MAEFESLQDRLDKKINKYHTPANNPEGVYGGGSYDIFGQIGDTVVPYLQDRINDMFGGTKKTSEQHLLNPDRSIGVTKTQQPKYRSRREGLDATYPAKKPYRSRREGLDATYPDRKPSESSGGGGGNTGRSAPDPAGTGATGTNTSFKGYGIDLGVADALLGRLNPKTGGKIADVNNFLSNDLPTVDISGSEFDATQRSDGTYNAPQKVVVGGKAVNFADLDGALSDTVVEGISTPGKTGISPADTADNNRSVSVPGDEPTDWSKPRQKSYSELRREAFLDPNNRGYGAIRAADAAVGRFRQGDKFFVNDGGNLREINEDSWRTGQHRALSASEMKGAYVDSIKETLVPVATADAFDVGETPITNAKQTTTDYMGDIAETEFNMNNVAPDVSDRARMKGDYFNAGDDDDED